MDNAPIFSPDPPAPAGPARERSLPSATTVPAGLSDREVAQVRARRASLRRACAQVRQALDAPPGTALAGAGAVLARVRELERVWASHSAETERPDGVLAQIVADAPRLVPAVGRLRREHARVADALRAVQRLLEQSPPDGPVDPVTAQPDLDRVLSTVDRHRRDGRALIYDAYNVDLGLGE